MFQIDSEQKQHFQKWASPKLKATLVYFLENIQPELRTKPELLGLMAEYAFQKASEFSFEAEVDILSFAGLMLEVGPNFYHQELLNRSLKINQDEAEAAEFSSDSDDTSDSRIINILHNCPVQAWVQAFALRQLELWFSGNQEKAKWLDDILQKRSGHPLARLIRLHALALDIANGDLITSEEKVSSSISLPCTDPVRDPLGRNVVKHKIDVQGINPVTGELILELNDFRLPGPLALNWMRIYRNSNIRDTALGVGWTYPGFEHLYVFGERIEYVDRRAQVFPFNIDDNGSPVQHLFTKISLYRDEEGYHIVDECGVERLFLGEGDRKSLHRIRDKFGNTQIFNYDENGRIETVELSRLSLLFQYDKNNYISVILLSTGESAAFPLVTYGYDRHGSLVEVSHHSGGVEKYRYKGQCITDQVLKTGLHISYKWTEHGPEGRCVFRSAAKKNMARYIKYKKNQTLIQDALGNTRTINFDAMGNIVELSDQEGVIFSFSYDQDGNLMQRVDAEDGVATFEYNILGKLIGKTNEANLSRQWRYDKKLRLSSYTDYAGARYRRAYDEKDQVSSITDPLGRQITISYNPLGLPFIINNVYGQERMIIWDEQGNISELDDNLGNQLYAYNPIGQLLESQKGSTITQYAYDKLGNLQGIKIAEQQLYSFKHNEGGKLIAQGDVLGGQWRFLYDGFDEVVETVDPLGGRIRFSYNEERKLIGITNENGEACQFVYDHKSRLMQEQGYDGRLLRYFYNKVGHLIKFQDAEFEFDMERDQLGNLLSIKYADSGYSFEYDAMGRTTLAQGNDTKISREYNSAGNLVEEWQNRNMLRYLYDDIGRKITTWVGDGSDISYNYDEVGRVSAIFYHGEALVQWQRGDDGIINSTQYGNGFVDNFEFELGRLKRRKLNFKEEVILHSKFEHDPLGRIIKDEDNIYGKHEYRYDALGRFLACDGLFPEYYCYDPAGNLLETAQRGNLIAAYQTKSFAGYQIEYDSRGNIVSLQGSEAGAMSLEYNGFNQLVKIQGSVNCSYQYDYYGRRLLKTDELGDTYYVWDGDLLIQEVRNFKAVTYIYDPVSKIPVAQIREGEIFYCHNDSQNRPILLSDAQGEVVWQGRYNQLSGIVKNEIEIGQNNLRQAGHYYDYETGMHFDGSRYYHPVLGRYIQQASFKNRKSLNPYGE